MVPWQEENRLIHAPLTRGAVRAGSNPAVGTFSEVPKDPAISGNAEDGVFVYVQMYATPSGPMTRSVDSSADRAGDIAPYGEPAGGDASSAANHHCLQQAVRAR
jgi:hypothetical protein